MVEDRAIERFRRRCEATGRPAIRIARPWIAARMIVGHDDAGAAMLSGVGDDVPQRKAGARLVSIVAGNVDAAGLGVDMRDPQAFARRIGFRETTRKEGFGGGEAVELKRVFGTLIPHRALVRACYARRRIQLGPKAPIIARMD